MRGDFGCNQDGASRNRFATILKYPRHPSSTACLSSPFFSSTLLWLAPSSDSSSLSSIQTHPPSSSADSSSLSSIRRAPHPSPLVAVIVTFALLRGRLSCAPMQLPSAHPAAVPGRLEGSLRGSPRVSLISYFELLGVCWCQPRGASVWAFFGMR
eukprot:9039853-Pyramimonas_sp.AAC.1